MQKKLITGDVPGHLIEQFGRALQFASHLPDPLVSGSAAYRDMA